jgi:hypothetical protein
MDARRKINLRFLVVSCFLVIALATSSAERVQRGALYVIPTLGRCSETVLPLKLDGITPLPSEVLLRVKRRADEKELVAQQLNLNGGGYSWSGLLAPLGSYRAQLYDAKDKTTLLGEFTFNNIDILKDFIRQERGEITYINRGGEEAETPSDPERKSLIIDQIPASNGRNQLHIIVMSSQGKKADEYFGSPPSERQWKSRPLPVGQYRLIVVEYKGDGNCQVIRGG